MKASIALTPRARDDLEEIWNYTADRWGIEQAETYIRTLWRDFELIVSNPKIGRPCPEIRDGYRKRAAGSHVTFYRSGDTGIEIVRVLHKRMDVSRHISQR